MPLTLEVYLRNWRRESPTFEGGDEPPSSSLFSVRRELRCPLCAPPIIRRGTPRPHQDSRTNSEFPTEARRSPSGIRRVPTQNTHVPPTPPTHLAIHEETSGTVVPRIGILPTVGTTWSMVAPRRVTTGVGCVQGVSPHAPTKGIDRRTTPRPRPTRSPRRRSRSSRPRSPRPQRQVQPRPRPRPAPCQGRYRRHRRPRS